MAEKLIPDVQVFAQEIFNESRLDLPAQRVKMAERLMNLPVETLPEIHLEQWYQTYWKLVNLSAYLNDPPDARENAARQIISLAAGVSEPVRRQYFALALLLFGKGREALALIDKNLWAKNLRDDFETFTRWNSLANVGPNLATRAALARNKQIKNFLQNRYSNLIRSYSKATTRNCPRAEKYRIWYCWLQGEENLPITARCCYNSLKQNAGRYEICFIDEKNYADYVDLPEHIVKKFKGGGITRTHFSDILRVNLLYQYGGLWIDSTILVTEPLERHKNLWKLPYVTQKFFNGQSNSRPFAENPSYGRWMTGLQGSSLVKHPMFRFMKDFYDEYWRDTDEIIDYFLMDFIMGIAYDNIAVIRSDMDAVPINNTEIWKIIGILNIPYAQFPYDQILKDTFLVKLRWKDGLDFNAQDTILKEIQRRYAPETI